MSQTATTTTCSSAPVQKTKLNYYVTSENGGTTDFLSGYTGQFRKKFDTHPMTITDMRSVGPENFSLNVQGFQLEKHTSAEKEWSGIESIKNVAYKEGVDLLKQKTGATHVHITSHLARRCGWETAKEATKDLADEDHIPLPNCATNHYVHIDQSTKGAIGLLREELGPGEASRLPKTKRAIINIWRPIKPITREPLALCDRRTVDAETDLHEVTLRIAQSDLMKHLNKGDGWSTWNLTFSEKHKWIYASDMTPEEVLLLKIYDSGSKLEGQSRGVPHCAFVMEEERGPERESVEMRCFVFGEDQEN